MAHCQQRIKYDQNQILLADTSCSIINTNICLNNHEKKHSKKRIGPYSFYFKNLIGSGYSGKVYVGIKNDDKTQRYAIKVVKTKQMNRVHRELLNNEVQIMRQLNHTNILKLIDVYRTTNHCYIITQYCDGGNLENYIQKQKDIDWGNIIYQIGEGCKYLGSNEIIHRDIKPANILLKDGRWVISDFGFSKKISSPHEVIVQSYKVGSPLYMPLEILCQNKYSIKGDSFSLGVLIYYLILKQFPWKGLSTQELISSYKTSPIDWAKFQFLPTNALVLLQRLCQIDIQNRISLVDCNFDVFLRQRGANSKRIFNDLKSDVAAQVKLCHFINYLMRNSMVFLCDSHPLYSLISLHLNHLITLFQWSNSLKEIKNQYILTQGVADERLYRRLVNVLKSTIEQLCDKKDNLSRVGLQKFLDYYAIVQAFLSNDEGQLIKQTKMLALHQNFTSLLPNEGKIKDRLSIFNK